MPQILETAVVQEPLHLPSLQHTNHEDNLQEMIWANPATSSSTSANDGHQLMQLWFAQQYSPILPHQFPVPFDALRDLWEYAKGNLQGYAARYGGLDFILAALHNLAKGATCEIEAMDVAALRNLQLQLHCMALVSACSAAAVLQAVHNKPHINPVHDALQIFSLLKGLKFDGDTYLLSKDCQRAAVKVVLHLVVTSEQWALHSAASAAADTTAQSAVAGRLKALCVEGDANVRMLKELADGEDFAGCREDPVGAAYGLPHQVTIKGPEA
jgi:hypothetical protein